MIRRHSFPIFGALRVLVAGYGFLVPLEKPANNDRKSESLKKPITENRLVQFFQRYKISQSDIFMQKARFLTGTDLCLFWLD